MLSNMPKIPQLNPDVGFKPRYVLFQTPQCFTFIKEREECFEHPLYLKSLGVY